LSIVGLGCSSFSTFFDAKLESLDKNDETVQEWIRTIHHAIRSGINLLDTAPWYGHGTSEIVVGWALEELFSSEKGDLKRQNLVINTKVGRYKADPKEQFDFSYAATIKSVNRSLQRLQCDYIDVLQLHDPEFAPSLEQLLDETIPAMRECQDKGYCCSLGLTGYPLQTQLKILLASLQRFGTNIWDQALTYGHFNLHDSSLIQKPLTIINDKPTSFLDALRNEHNMGVLAAAPLSMGLLTKSGPPEWHPAPRELKEASLKANEICETLGVNISHLAIMFAISAQSIPCTILGMKNVDQVNTSCGLALRFADIEKNDQDQNDILKAVLSSTEYRAYEEIVNPETGPFASHEHWAWDGIKGALEFWKELGVEVENWQGHIGK
jgi:aryl-alcohol dehydrogenase-like predicted oxidoreductase